MWFLAGFLSAVVLAMVAVMAHSLVEYYTSRVRIVAEQRAYPRVNYQLDDDGDTRENTPIPTPRQPLQAQPQTPALYTLV